MDKLDRVLFMDRRKRKDSGIIYDDVWRAARPVDDGRRELPHCVRLREIAGNHQMSGTEGVSKGRKRIAVLGDKRDADACAVHGARYGRTDSAGRPRHQRRAVGKNHRKDIDGVYAKRKNSSRVLASSRNEPRTADVIVFEFCFSTPRIIIHKW